MIVPRIVVARDSGSAVLISELNPQEVRSLTVAYNSAVLFEVQTEPGSRPVRGYVEFEPVQSVASLKYILEQSGRGGDTIEILLLSAIGAHLDSEGVGGFIVPEGKAVVVSALNPFLDELERRRRATDREIEEFLAATAYAAWRFGHQAAFLSIPEQLRLGVRGSDIGRIANLFAGELWDSSLDGQGNVFVAAEKALIRQFQNGARGVQGHAAMLLIRGQLAAPRYHSVLVHYDKAIAFAEDAKPDHANAAKEAISALESMAMIASGSSGTLGAALTELREKRGLHPAIARALEALWGFTNTSPGVRHGGPEPPTITKEQARLVINLCGAAIQYLLTIDATR